MYEENISNLSKDEDNDDIFKDPFFFLSVKKLYR